MKKLICVVLCSLLLVGCGSPAPVETSESSKAQEKEYQTPEGYNTVSLNGYLIDYPGSWTETGKSENNTSVAFYPDSDDQTTMAFARIVPPDTFEEYTQGKSLDDILLEHVNESMFERSMSAVSGGTTDSLDLPYGKHCVMTVWIDGEYNATVISCYIDEMIAQVTLMIPYGDDALRYDGDIMSMISSIRPE